ncbi:solute carrier family 22 member 20-like [Monodelphis domestica]|uniref:solute carrier family 22 member 20-like n=1 Tax=Monodelphis domestica TaxID=13616 RepID=UPI0024E1F387|nr:solute carrier family 22 member 20-like [Monodelphis domestica]
MGFSELLGTIGGMGRFQFLLTALMSIPGILFVCHTILLNFTGVVPEHHCQLQNHTSPESPLLGDGRDGTLRVYIPMDKAGKPEMCLRFTEPQWQLLNANVTEEARPATEDCLDGWVYDKSVSSSSIVTEWDLVCEWKSLKYVAQIIYMGGQQAGTVMFGILSDRLGRRTMLLWSSLMATITGTCTALMPSFAGYVIFQFLTGAGTMGLLLTSNCLTLEWTPTGKRIFVNACNTYAFTIGQIVVAAWAYLVQEWRWLQFSISIACGIIVLFSLVLPESACWLITHNKLHTAMKSLQKVAWINGHKEEGRKLTPEGIMSHIQEDLTTVKPTSHLRDLYRTPGICKITLSVLFAWLSRGFSFYGLVLDLQKFGFSIYLVQVLFALIDFPARLLTAISLSYMGRRFTLIFCTVFSGLMTLIGIFVPQDLTALRMTLSVLGKGGLAGAISSDFLYTLELYPTEIRQIGMSVGVFASRVGSLLAPVVFIIGIYIPILQPLLFGIVPLLSAIAISFRIETRGLPLLDTIQETENRIKKAQSLKGNVSKDVQEGPAFLLPEMSPAESTV